MVNTNSLRPRPAPYDEKYLQRSILRKLYTGLICWIPYAITWGGERQSWKTAEMSIQYHLWDKLKELSSLSQSQITNLAKFLAHLFVEKALPISVLKVMQFSEMDKASVRLLRQTLLSLLLVESAEVVAMVFARVARPDKLRMFRESLRLFLHHFVLRNATELPEDRAQTLRERVALAETALTSSDTAKLKL